MKTAAIVIDRWKLPVFKRRLDAASYNFTEHDGSTPESMVLKVPYEEGSSFVALTKIVRAAQLECKES